MTPTTRPTTSEAVARRPIISRQFCAVLRHNYEGFFCTWCGDWDARGVIDAAMKRYAHILTGSQQP